MLVRFVRDCPKGVTSVMRQKPKAMSSKHSGGPWHWRHTAACGDHAEGPHTFLLWGVWWTLCSEVKWRTENPQASFPMAISEQGPREHSCAEGSQLRPVHLLSTAEAQSFLDLCWWLQPDRSLLPGDWAVSWNKPMLYPLLEGTQSGHLTTW